MVTWRHTSPLYLIVMVFTDSFRARSQTLWAPPHLTLHSISLRSTLHKTKYACTERQKRRNEKQRFYKAVSLMHRLKKTVLIQTYSMETRYKKLSVCREYQSFQPVKTFKHLTQIKQKWNCPNKRKLTDRFYTAFKWTLTRVFIRARFAMKKITFFEEAKF